eukprot:TRINITY_DN21230_c0_g1_i1.p1 TRINITY_DN21230_c0_g1~~TRINITY_DN21230_c0_g1_i1.p1  ORF type:complete len:608 (-),score=64.40 TRINITY_DN21230_c0_g1_i1:231-2003(-)
MDGFCSVFCQLSDKGVSCFLAFLQWRHISACRALSRSIERNLDDALLRSSLAALECDCSQTSVCLPASLFHAGIVSQEWKQSATIPNLCGVSDVYREVSKLRLLRVATPKTVPSHDVLSGFCGKSGVTIPKSEVLRFFLRSALTNHQRLRLVQDFMSMCLVSQSVREGRGNSAGLFRSLSVAQRNFFASVDLTPQAVIVVGNIAGAGNDPVQHDPRRLCEIFAHIYDLADAQTFSIPACRSDSGDSPNIVGGPFVQEGPALSAQVDEKEKDAFEATISFTCRAIRSYLNHLRMATKCKALARGEFQAKRFAEALKLYKVAMWHNPQGDSTLYSNAALCCLQLSQYHAAADHAINALCIDEGNAKAAHALMKTELQVKYTMCNGWQHDLLDLLSQANKSLVEMREKHKCLRAPSRQTLWDELGSEAKTVDRWSQSPTAEGRLLFLIADEEQNHGTSLDNARRLLTAALVRGAEGAALPLIDTMVEADPRASKDACLACSLLASAPVSSFSMEAALKLGEMSSDKVTAYLYMAVAVASQDAAVLQQAGDALIDRILKNNNGRWSVGNPYSTFLMALGGQSERISDLMRQSSK